MIYILVLLSFDDSNGNSLSLFISLIYLTFVISMFYVDEKMLHWRLISEDFMRQEGFVWYEKGLAFWAVEKATFFRASKLRIISRRRVRWRGFWLWKCLVIPKAKRKQKPEAGKFKVKQKKLNPKPHMPKKNHAPRVIPEKKSSKKQPPSSNAVSGAPPGKTPKRFKPNKSKPLPIPSRRWFEKGDLYIIVTMWPMWLLDIIQCK